MKEKLFGEQEDGKPPQRVLDEYMQRVGPSIKTPELPRYWFWNNTKTYASYEDYVED